MSASIWQSQPPRVSIYFDPSRSLCQAF
jgi:hypothetical protein